MNVYRIIMMIQYKNILKSWKHYSSYKETISLNE